MTITLDENPVIDQREYSTFEEILIRLNAEGKFTASVLVSQDGLPIASAPTPSPLDTEIMAAMVAMVKDFILQTQERLGLAEVDEVSMVVGDRSRLVCRYFSADHQPFVLAVFAPPNISYRRLTTHAVREIQAAWENSSA
ncbi:MAG: roadblock/LC7 domain-containing protein [Chloroflexi bacterium]|nr:roadblock/LC7 domain-containing protein [Chloroflexota bacterium]